MKTFTYTYYRQDDAGNIYRRIETIVPSYHTKDGGYVPGRVVGTAESEVRTVDSDYPDALDYLQEINRPY
jgi:hypothetical protein